MTVILRSVIVIYHMLKEGTAYCDLGSDFLDRLRSTHLIRFHLRLQHLGLNVTITPEPA